MRSALCRTAPALVVYLRRRHMAVAKQIADAADVDSGIEKQRRDGRPERMRRVNHQCECQKFIEHRDRWPGLIMSCPGRSRGWPPCHGLGPVNCLPFRISEAILKPLRVLQGMSVLTYESLS